MQSESRITQQELASLFPDGVPMPVMKMIFPEKSEKLTVEDIWYILNAMRSEAALSTDAEPVAFTNAAQLKKLSDPSRWHEATICPVGDGAYDIPLYAEPVKTAPAVALTRLAIRTGGSGANVYAYTEADDDGDYVFYTEALSALSAQVQDVARCLDCDGYNCDDGCAYPDPAPVAQVQDVAIPVAWQFRCEIFPEWQTTDRKPGDQLQMEYETGVNMKGLEVRPLYAGFSANTLDLEGWKEIPPETVVEEATKGKQVLAYENGRYYNAWLEFEASEGGWLWYDDADSEPNPSHWMHLPSSPAPKHGETGWKDPTIFDDAEGRN